MERARQIEPFPYRRWPKVTRAEVERRRRVTRWLPPSGLERVLEELGALAGGRFTVVSEELFSVSTRTLEGALPDPLVALPLAVPGMRPGHGPVIELDRAFSASLIDRLLGGEGLSDGGIAALDGVRAGVLAFAAGRALARLPEPRPRLMAVWTTPAVVKAYLDTTGEGGGRVEVWSLVLRHELEGGRVETTTARAWIPPLFVPIAESPPAGPANHAVSSRTGLLLRALEVSAVVDAAAGTLPGRELVGLAPGDAVVLERCFSTAGVLRLRALGGRQSTWWIERAAGSALRVLEIEQGLSDRRYALPESERESGGARRSVLLGSKGSEAGEHVSEQPGQRDDDEPRTERTSPQRPEGPPVDVGGTLARLGDAPVELAVELARFRLSVEELAALRPGEVLPAGALIGGAAHLRAGELLVAKGELVDIDGESGFRVTEVLGA